MSVAVACLSCGASGAELALDRAHLIRCQTCGAVYWDEPWTAQRVRSHYEQYYASPHCDRDALTEHRYEVLLERFERGRGAGRLLDLGCGEGRLVGIALSRGWQVTALEVSASAIRHLEALRTSASGSLSIVATDVLEAGLPRGRFDLVTMIEVLEHLTEPIATLRTVHELLREGGRLYLTTPNYNSLSRYALGARWRVIGEEHRCLFMPSALARALRRAGFRCERMRTKNLDVPSLPAVWRRGQDDAPHPTHPASATQQLRHQLEAAPWLRASKAVVNVMLGATGTGDTIEAVAIKRRLPG